MKRVLKGLCRILSHLVPVVAAFNAMFAVMIILNWMRITFYYGYRGEWLRLVLFSPELDTQLFWATFLLISLTPWASILYERMTPPGTIVLTHMILPLSAIGFFTAMKDSGLAISAYFGGLASIVTLYYAERTLRIPVIRALSIAGLTMGLTYIPIGIISAFTMNRDPAGLIAWFAKPGTPRDLFERLAQLDIHIFFAGYPWIEYLLLAFLFGWVWAPTLSVIQAFTRRLGRVRPEKDSRFVSTKREDPGFRFFTQHANYLRALYTWLPRIGAAAACLLGIYVIQFPYFFHTKPIGVDASWYVNTVSQVNSFGGLVNLLMNEPRAPYVILLIGMRELVGLTPEATVMLGPMLLLALFAAAIYAFTATALRNEYIALLASALSIFSIQTTVGMYAAIYTNWFALAEIALFYTFLVNWIENGTRRSLIGAALTSLLVLFTHAWTWAVLIAALGVQAILTALIARRRIVTEMTARREFRSAIAIAGISAGFAVAILLAVLSLPVATGIRQGILSSYEIVKSMELKYALRIQYVLFKTIKTYVGGFLANGLLFSIAILGVWGTRKFSYTFQRILFSWLLVTSILTLLLDSWFQWRILYIIPYSLAASVGIGLLARGILDFQLKTSPQRVDRVFACTLVAVIVIALFMALVNYTFRSIVYVAMLF